MWDIEVFSSLPFDINENPVNISQGFNWPWSHYTFPNLRLCLEYAVDFALPVWTKILAVKDWVVALCMDLSNESYEWDNPDIGMKYGWKANLIRIKTECGFDIDYIHLAQNSIKVKIGDIIKAGDPLAHTWKSWWIGPKPHLHFQYSYWTRTEWLVTVPFRFKDYPYSLEHSDL